MGTDGGGGGDIVVCVIVPLTALLTVRSCAEAGATAYKAMAGISKYLFFMAVTLLSVTTYTRA